MSRLLLVFCFFFFNDTATTEIYTLSLHDALPIFMAMLLTKNDVLVRARHHRLRRRGGNDGYPFEQLGFGQHTETDRRDLRSEEHTSELQSQSNLVCRLLLEKKKKLYTIELLRNYT